MAVERYCHADERDSVPAPSSTRTMLRRKAVRRRSHGFSARRPNLVGNPNHGPRTVGAWLNTSAYQRLDLTANAGQFGTEGRNVNTGPAFADWDFAALKNFKVTESKQFQFRAELFNVLNRANFRLPDSDISSPTFNHILASEAPRQVQFALKFMY